VGLSPLNLACDPADVHFAVRASFGQSSICTRATSRYLPPSGLKIEASPSLTSNQSLPRGVDDIGLLGPAPAFCGMPRLACCFHLASPQGRPL
jgi:hypothetical protein